MFNQKVMTSTKNNFTYGPQLFNTKKISNTYVLKSFFNNAVISKQIILCGILYLVFFIL